MGYQIYKVGERWGGYGVPALCEHPNCNEEIDRGVSYACGGEPFSEHGCDRYFCGKHLFYVAFKDDGKRCRHQRDCDCKHFELCKRCKDNKKPFNYKPETEEWITHLLKHKSWKEWRQNNLEEVNKLKKIWKKQSDRR